MKPITIHPLSFLLGAGVLALVALATSAQRTSEFLGHGSNSTVRVAGIPHPNEIIRIDEGTPYVVPNGRRFVVIVLGLSQEGKIQPFFAHHKRVGRSVGHFAEVDGFEAGDDSGQFPIAGRVIAKCSGDGRSPKAGKIIIFTNNRLRVASRWTKENLVRSRNCCHRIGVINITGFDIGKNLKSPSGLLVLA